MKLLEMKRIRDNDYIYSEEDTPLVDYMVKLETHFEESIYRNLVECSTHSPVFDQAMREELGVIDDDISYFWMEGEQEPQIGETFELDDMVWERIA